jgi:hypothetical protein
MMNSMANMLIVGFDADSLCFPCFHETLQSPFVGQCSWTTCSMPQTTTHRAKETRKGRRGNNEELNRGITRDKMLERFRKARQFTAGVVYFSGKGELDADVLVEVQRRFDNRKANSSKIEASKTIASGRSNQLTIPFQPKRLI